MGTPTEGASMCSVQGRNSGPYTTHYLGAPPQPPSEPPGIVRRWGPVIAAVAGLLALIGAYGPRVVACCGVQTVAAAHEAHAELGARIAASDTERRAAEVATRDQLQLIGVSMGEVRGLLEGLDLRSRSSLALTAGLARRQRVEVPADVAGLVASPAPAPVTAPVTAPATPPGP